MFELGYYLWFDSDSTYFPIHFCAPFLDVGISRGMPHGRLPLSVTNHSLLLGRLPQAITSWSMPHGRMPLAITSQSMPHGRLLLSVSKNPSMPLGRLPLSILPPEHVFDLFESPCFWWVCLKPGLTTWYFLDIFFVTPTNYGHKFFVCLATVFGKPTDQHLLSRCACEIDVWKKTQFSLAISFDWAIF